MATTKAKKRPAHPPGVRPARGGDGRWELRVSLGPDPDRPGKYIEVSRTVGPGLTAKQAKMERDRWIVELEAEQNVKRGAGTFNALIDEWLESLEVSQHSDKTIETYKGYLKKWVRPRLGKMPVRSLDIHHFNAVYAEMSRAGKSPKTINQVHAICRRVCNQGIAWKWLTTNPTHGTTRPPVEPTDIDPPSPEDIGRLLEWMGGDEGDPALLMFLVLSAAVGTRRGETCAMRWSDVDWDERRIRVSRAVGVRKAKMSDGERRQSWTIKRTKNRRMRFVDVPETVMETLTDFRKSIEARAEMYGVKLRPDSYVFSRDPDGTRPLRPGAPTAAFDKAREAVNLPNARLHDLRHFVATQALSKGADLTAVSRLLGHTKISTTLDIYTHYITGNGKATAAIIDDVLGLRSLNLSANQPKELA